MSEQRLNIPVPDPSALTTEALRREISMLGDQMRREIAALRELHQTKFDAMNALIDHDARAAREAIASAMAAQKEAAQKSELATGDLLKALDRRVDEVKERLDTGEGATKGSFDTRSERRQDLGLIVGSISLLISIAIAIITLPHAAPVPVTVAPPPASAWPQATVKP